MDFSYPNNLGINDMMNWFIPVEKEVALAVRKEIVEGLEYERLYSLNRNGGAIKIDLGAITRT